jgi:hypothetical protein
MLYALGLNTPLKDAMVMAFSMKDDFRDDGAALRVRRAQQAEKARVISEYRNLPAAFRFGAMLMIIGIPLVLIAVTIHVLKHADSPPFETSYGH